MTCGCREPCHVMRQCTYSCRRPPSRSRLSTGWLRRRVAECRPGSRCRSECPILRRGCPDRAVLSAEQTAPCPSGLGVACRTENPADQLSGLVDPWIVVGLGALAELGAGVGPVGASVAMSASAVACCPLPAARSICLANARCCAIRFSAKSNTASRTSSALAGAAAPGGSGLPLLSTARCCAGSIAPRDA